MSEKFIKILKVAKDVFKWIGLFLLGFFAVKTISELGKPEKADNWEPMPGHKNQVLVNNEDGTQEVVTLPKDPETNKPLKNTKVIAVGISKEGGKTDVKKVSVSNDSVNDSRTVGMGG